ncbi:long-chain-fatty-acid--CoA ligase [Sabulicella rubraurantiaca]|uniref:long-chain-fatty-acid--CoA ligase n=1 Tax=Sabulicella rubraurantiaca TaxID=2811429 RepID=UPI001A9640D4|nr:long-chain-fatty-acid--CoA ligase [Sabulicella rubraurantiaca]
MLGLMQDWPLLMHCVIDHAAQQHPQREVISRSVEGPIHHTNYAAIRRRALRLAQCLTRSGIRQGDRVATMAWNTSRHLEAWYGITGIGAIYHTVNPRLFEKELVWILNHAESRLILADLSFVPLLEKIAHVLPHIERYVILTDAAHMPSTSLRGAVAYEDWLGQVDGDFVWASLDENTAAGLCYTSGTTGEPKGVLYSHRSNLLAALSWNGGNGFGFNAAERVMAVVPMFHANGWLLPLCAPIAGAAMILPGAKLDAASLHEMAEIGRATYAAAVPTLWTMLLQYLDATGAKLSTLRRVGIGGAAVPRSLIQAYDERYGVRVDHGWGMTETSPAGTCNTPKPEVAGLEGEAELDRREKQGFPHFTVELKITDDEGTELPWDGKTAGRLKVRGPAVARAYYGRDGSVLDGEGFLDTGDIATIDPHGYMQITDRAKDLIKSGGEWISSVALENAAAGHPDIAEAAAIAVPHPRWGERPLLLVVPKPNTAPTRQEIIAFLQGKLAKWWLPDNVAFMGELPHTATGKVDKKALRLLMRDRQSAEEAELPAP